MRCNGTVYALKNITVPLHLIPQVRSKIFKACRWRICTKFAFENENLDAAKVLLENGANLNFLWGGRPLIFAIITDNIANKTEAVLLLLKWGAKITTDDIHCAITHGEQEIADLLISAKFALDESGQNSDL